MEKFNTKPLSGGGSGQINLSVQMISARRQ